VSCSRGYWCSDEHPTSPGCGKHFWTLESFEAHRVASSCLSSSALIGQGWHLEEGFWLSPRDLARRERVRVRPSQEGSRRVVSTAKRGVSRGTRTDGRAASSEVQKPADIHPLERTLHEARVLQALEPGLRAAELARRGTTWREHYRALLEALSDPRAREILGQVTHTRLLAAAQDAFRYPPRELPLPGQLPLEGTR
jgi:hypothetical protein